MDQVTREIEAVRAGMKRLADLPAADMPEQIKMQMARVYTELGQVARGRAERIAQRAGIGCHEGRGLYERLA